jgi:hypothetical protein
MLPAEGGYPGEWDARAALGRAEADADALSQGPGRSRSQPEAMARLVPAKLVMRYSQRY